MECYDEAFVKEIVSDCRMTLIPNMPSVKSEIFKKFQHIYHDFLTDKLITNLSYLKETYCKHLIERNYFLAFRWSMVRLRVIYEKTGEL